MLSSTVFISICVWLRLLVYMRPLAGAVNKDDLLISIKRMVGRTNLIARTTGRHILIFILMRITT